MMRSGKLFARKFDMEIDAKVFDAIESRMLNRQKA
jgi:hypothetical protein